MVSWAAQVPSLSTEQREKLSSIASDLTVADGLRVKEIERKDAL